MSKKVISPVNLEVKELEEKIAPTYYSNVLLGSLFNGISNYVGGDNSWHWGDTYNRMSSYLGYNYDPMGVIYGNYQPYHNYTPNIINNFLNTWLY